MVKNIPLTVFPVKDVEKAKVFYSTFLGTEPYVDGSYYVGYKVGEQEIGLDPNANDGPIVYIDTADIKSSISEMLEAGAEVVQDPQDVGAGLLIAKLKDADGNTVGLRQS